jgi:hypothetical protein
MKAGERARTEFVIVFYWHEPLPTEPEPKEGYLEANTGGGGDGTDSGGTGGGAPAGPPPPAGGGDGGGGRKLPEID